MRGLVGVLAFSIPAPLAAQAINYPVPIPGECTLLAEREHVPTMIENRYQALRAEYKLYHLNKSDPLVAQCRKAVARLTAQYREK